MLKRSVIPVLLLPMQASAVDSHQIMQVAGIAANASTGGALSSVLGGATEVAGVGFAFGDLLGELGVDQNADEEIQRSLDKISSLQSQMDSFSSAGFRMKSLSEDLRTSQSLEDRMQTLKTMIQISKSLSVLMSGSPGLGEKAFKVQDVRLNYMILDELMAIRRLQYQESLAKRERDARLGILLAEVNIEERKAAKKRSGR